MSCGCNGTIREFINEDPYIGKKVILISGEEGTIFSRLIGNKSTYLFESNEGKIITIRIVQIERII